MTISPPAPVAAQPAPHHTITAKILPTPPRFTQLDAVRGLAALAVVLQHYALVFEAGTPFSSLHSILEIARWTPLSAVIGGHQAVLVFFILSGFVLTLMLNRSGAPTYPLYLWRRVCRLYLPYAAAIALAVILSTTLYRGSVPELGQWFNQFWTQQWSFSSLINHAMFVTYFDTGQFNYVIWTLVHEMRLSIIFPLMLVWILRYGWRKSLILAFALSVVVAPIYFLTIDNEPMIANLVSTLHYALFFVVGALLALHLNTIRMFYSRLSTRSRAFLFSAGLISYCYGLFPDILLGVGNPMLLSWLTLPGATVVVGLALCSGTAIRLLDRPLPQFLGRISYSLYLLHPLVQLGLVHLLYGQLPLGAILVLAFVLTFPLSYLFYLWVEVPSIALGHRFTRARTAGSKQPG